MGVAATEAAQREAAENEVRASEIGMVGYKAAAAECESAVHVVEAAKWEVTVMEATGDDTLAGESEATLTEAAECGATGHEVKAAKREVATMEAAQREVAENEVRASEITMVGDEAEAAEC